MTPKERRERIYWHVENEYGFTEEMVALEKDIRTHVDPEIWLLIVEMVDLGVHRLTVLMDAALANEKPGLTLTA